MDMTTVRDDERGNRKVEVELLMCQYTVKEFFKAHVLKNCPHFCD